MNRSAIQKKRYLDPHCQQKQIPKWQAISRQITYDSPNETLRLRVILKLGLKLKRKMSESTPQLSGWGRKPVRASQISGRELLADVLGVTDRRSKAPVVSRGRDFAPVGVASPCGLLK